MLSPNSARGATVKPIVLTRSLLVFLACFAAIELYLFYWLAAQGPEAFVRSVTVSDSASYIRIAEGLFQNGILLGSHRTPGYPALLYASFLLGGESFSIHVVIAIQLALNLALVLGSSALLARLAPQLSSRFRTAATVVVFLAGLGPAFRVLSDLLAAACFFLFVYGLFFWRGRTGTVLAAVGLAAATLTRPTFTFIPLLLPLLAVLLKEGRLRQQQWRWIVFLSASAAATVACVAYQHWSHGTWTPSTVVSSNVSATLEMALPPSHRRLGTTFERWFEEELSRRADRPFAAIPVREREALSRSMLVAALRQYPRELAMQLGTTAVKYALAPIELWARVVADRLGIPSPIYARFRILIVALCLPLWVACLMPPSAADPYLRRYYFIVMALLTYVIVMSSIAPEQGERIRYPLVPFLIPIGIINANQWAAVARGRR